MAANIEEQLIERLRGLSEHRQAEVLKFAEELADVEPLQAVEPRRGQVPIWDKIEEIMSDVPEEVLARVPTDGSIHVDHYLYGAPKKQP